MFLLSPRSRLHDCLLSPKMLSQPLKLLCFLLSILYSPPSSPSYPTLSSLTLPSSQHRAVNLRQWQTPTSKSAILIPPRISIMEQLDMKALLSGPSWLTVCCIPSVNREKKEKKWGDTRGRKKKGGGCGSLITAMGLMDVWALNWLPMTVEVSPCFNHLSAGFHSLVSLFPSLTFSPSPCSCSTSLNF